MSHAALGNVLDTLGIALAVLGWSSTVIFWRERKISRREAVVTALLFALVIPLALAFVRSDQPIFMLALVLCLLAANRTAGRQLWRRVLEAREIFRRRRRLH